MPTFFVDTNLFLQCRSLSELPWKDLADGTDVLLVIPRIVQQEIDRHKRGGNSRRTRRARIASSLFRKIIQTPELRMILSAEHPSVVLRFSPLLERGREWPRELDPTQPDDRIVEEALACRSAGVFEDIRLLTDDTNLMLTARQCDLPCVSIPESWLLPPEPDERDKRMQVIERRLHALESDRPDVTIAMLDDEGRSLERIHFSITVYPELSRPEIDRLMEQVQTAHPMATRFEGHGRPMPTTRKSPLFPEELPGFERQREFEPPSSEAIRRYQEEKYPNWLRDVRAVFESLPNRLGLDTRTAALAVVLANDGGCPAEGVVVEIRTSGGILMTEPKGSANKQSGAAMIRTLPTLPAPPSAPSAVYAVPVSARAAMESALVGLQGPSLLEAIDLLGDRKYERDPHAFYWKERPVTAVSERVLTCESFRHKVEPEPVDLVLIVPSDATATSAAVQVRVTASNLNAPVSGCLPVTLSYKEGSTFEIAQRLIR